jgi:hypothetical protein
MRRLLFVSILVGGGVASARPRVQVQEGNEGATVVVDGVSRWRGTEVTSPLAYDRGVHAVAFTARNRSGPELVVVLLDGDAAGQMLSWPIPRDTQARAVVWLGPSRIAAGPSEFEPRVTASWQLSSR